MSNANKWRNAASPDYSTNVDKLYPYSEVPHMGEYSLVRIPLSINDFIDHVDYWGQGRIRTTDGIVGFSNCYNVNLAYECDSISKYLGRKIPNRIPVVSSDNCDTSAYVKDNSVVIVTVMRHSISRSCAADIVRIVNKDQGIVVAYGYSTVSDDMDNLSQHLRDKGIYYCPNYALPKKLQKITRYANHMIFLNMSLIKTELHRLITKENYANAIPLSKRFNNKVCGYVIAVVLDKILNDGAGGYNKVMTYAYQLWNNGGEEVVRIHFPSSFILILGNETVKIVNKEYNQALKLDELNNGDRIALGSHNQKIRDSWQFDSVYIDETLIFTIYNIDSNMYLKSAIESNEDRKTYGSIENDTDMHKYILEPFIKGGILCFHIIHYVYREGLKLDQSADVSGDRRVLRHNGDYQNEDSCKWIISEYLTNSKDM